MLVGLGAVFLGEKVTARKLGWLGLSFAGMLAIVSAHGDSDAPRGTTCSVSSWRSLPRCCMPLPR